LKGMNQSIQIERIENYKQGRIWRDPSKSFMEFLCYLLNDE